MQRCAVHPISQHGPDDTVIERDEIKRLVVFALDIYRWGRRRWSRVLAQHRRGRRPGLEILIDNHWRSLIGWVTVAGIVSRILVLIGRRIPGRIIVAVVSKTTVVSEAPVGVETRKALESETRAESRPMVETSTATESAGNSAADAAANVTPSAVRSTSAVGSAAAVPSAPRKRWEGHRKTDQYGR